MRIMSVTEGSINQQPKPYVIPSADYSFVGKNASRNSFTECLKSRIHDAEANAMEREAGGQMIGATWGFYLPDMVAKRNDPRQRGRVNDPQSDQ